MASWKFKACPVCGGDCHYDPVEEEWACLMCARRWYWAAPQAQVPQKSERRSA